MPTQPSEVMWQLGRLRPDYKSTAEFRRMHFRAVSFAGRANAKSKALLFLRTREESSSPPADRPDAPQQARNSDQ